MLCASLLYLERVERWSDWRTNENYSILLCCCCWVVWLAAVRDSKREWFGEIIYAGRCEIHVMCVCVSGVPHAAKPSLPCTIYSESFSVLSLLAHRITHRTNWAGFHAAHTFRLILWFVYLFFWNPVFSFFLWMVNWWCEIFVIISVASHFLHSY